MGLGAAIGGIAGGLISADAAGDAADAQMAAAQQQTKLYNKIYKQTKNALSPYYNSGTDALAALNYDMLGGEAPTLGSHAQEVERIKQNGNVRWQVGDQVFKSKDNAQIYANQNPTEGYEYGGYEASPGYAWAKEQGQSAIDGSAAARGNVFSGATLKAQQEYGTGLAQQDYNNYISQLMAMSNQGMNAATQTANAGNTYTAGASNALTNAANASSAASIATGNAINSGINSLIGAYGYMNPSDNALNSSTSTATKWSQGLW